MCCWSKIDCEYMQFKSLPVANWHSLMIYILYSLVKKNNDKVRKEMETNEKKQGEIS